MSSQNVTANDSIGTQLQVSETLTIGGVQRSNTYTYPPLSYQWANGTSSSGTVAGVIDAWYVDANRSLASAGTKTYTLSALTDDLGRTIALARVRELILQITTRTGNDYLTVGAAGTHPWAAPFSGTTPAELVRGLWHKVDDSPAALVVTSSSSDQLLVTNSGSATITYTFIVLGNTT